MRRIRSVSFTGFIIVFCLACWGSDNYTPKPRAYPKIEFPNRDYQAFGNEVCPLIFRYPGYAEVKMQESFFGEKPAHSCWFDLYVPAFDARIHCTYSSIDSRKEFDDLVHDSFTIANKINQRSQYMDEIRVANAAGVGGLIIEFTGPAASPLQFFLTDTIHHFFRGALYFNTQARPDSLEPITAFLKEDIAVMINSFEWTE